MFESVGDNAKWPPNVPGKPTQLAVFGVDLGPDGSPRYELTFTGQFPDLDKAKYWGAKQEVKAIKGGRFLMASRVLWQHDLTPEAAVAESFAAMEPQIRRTLSAAIAGTDVEATLGDDGPMRPVDYSKVDQMYVEVDEPRADGPDAINFIPPDPRSRPAGRVGDLRHPEDW